MIIYANHDFKYLGNRHDVMNWTSSMPMSVLPYVLDKGQYFGLKSVFTQSCDDHSLHIYHLECSVYSVNRHLSKVICEPSLRLTLDRIENCPINVVLVSTCVFVPQYLIDKSVKKILNCAGKLVF